jgi:peptidyl-prolyl cis-trans isomerase C
MQVPENTLIKTGTASINGVSLHAATERLEPRVLRQRACQELLRQQAIRQGLLAADDPLPVDGIASDAASEAIEKLTDPILDVPTPTDDECRRHHLARRSHYRRGDRAHVRHVLFAVTAGVDVAALRRRAEACLLDLARPGPDADARFAEAASTLSNCPSGAAGGALGWVVAGDCAPEFAKEILGGQEVGVLPRLVRSRFGLHVVEVLAREVGEEPPFEAVQGVVASELRQHAGAIALQQYLRVLAGAAAVVGVDLAPATTPLVQ